MLCQNLTLVSLFASHGGEKIHKLSKIIEPLPVIFHFFRLKELDECEGLSDEIATALADRAHYPQTSVQYLRKTQEIRTQLNQLSVYTQRLQSALSSYTTTYNLYPLLLVVIVHF